MIHNIELIPYKPDNTGWNQGNSFGNPIKISNVRVEPTSKVLHGDTGIEITAESLIFVDALYSTTLDINVKDKIVFNGIEREVIKVDTFYHGNHDKIHHLEVYCI